MKYSPNEHEVLNKNVPVSSKNYKKLGKLRTENDSFDDVITKVLENQKIPLLVTTSIKGSEHPS